jgi:hypothetical protein
MTQHTKPASKRFTQLGWRERLVPALLVLLLLGLLATMVVVILAVIGLTPGV